MRSVRLLTCVAALFVLTSCDDDPLNSDRGPEQPPPPAEGIQAYLQVDNDQARPGDDVHVWVNVQFAPGSDLQLGSYTGRITFDPAMLSHKESPEINDGLRVVNPEGVGEIRFAGASARGFEDLAIYHGVFEVKDPEYMTGLELLMEELSAAMTLADLQPQLQITPQIFLRRGN
ncbi:MAG: hypothetical protein PVH40_08985 [Gemmatimonadales bacterium]|jgi:hypothetical protein